MIGGMTKMADGKPMTTLTVHWSPQMDLHHRPTIPEGTVALVTELCGLGSRWGTRTTRLRAYSPTLYPELIRNECSLLTLPARVPDLHGGECVS
jgi:hypothetical protein